MIDCTKFLQASFSYSPVKNNLNWKKKTLQRTAKRFYSINNFDENYSINTESI